MIMNLLRKHTKVVAAFLLVNALYYTFGSAAAYALTSGPTAPEISSFEPVDATDMVNLATGDFSYSMPLIEIPGPAGNYPIALSYHPGISPMEEASWVGLGWSLNPGSISRGINGFPDDDYGNVTVSREFWEGG